MTRRKRLCLGISAGVVAGLLVVATWTGDASGATGVVEVGWWTRSPVADAPNGGFAVGADPTGTTSIAAVRLDVGRGVTSAVLVLSEAGGFGQDVAGLQVCSGPGGWTAADGGDLDDAPEPRCPGTSRLAVERGDGGRWTANVLPIVADRQGAVTVMVLPSDDANVGGALGLGFEVRFERPAFQAVERPIPPSPSTFARGPTTQPAEPEQPGEPEQPAEPTRPGDVFVPSRPRVPNITTTTAPEVRTPDDDEVTAPPIDVGGLDDDGDGGRPWGRLLLIVPVSAVVGGAAGAGRHYWFEFFG